MSDIPPTPGPGEPVNPTPTPETPPPQASTASPTPVAPIDYLGGPPPGDFSWNDFLTFRTMIAVPTIMILFWVGVVWCLIAGVMIMFSGGMRGFCSGVGMILFGPFVVRLYCEFLIVVFRINETLTDILNTLRGRPPRV